MLDVIYTAFVCAFIAVTALGHVLLLVSVSRDTNRAESDIPLGMALSEGTV
jgi:hypothetical protein